MTVVQDGQMTGSGWLGDRGADAFADDRARRLSRRRLLGFALCGALWALSIIPLARDATDDREGLRVLGVYLVVAAFSLGIAVVVRAIYAFALRRRRFWSPWLFLVAAVLAISGYVVHSAGEEPIPLASSLVSDRTP